MKLRAIGLLTAAALTLAACGGADDGADIGTDPNTAVLQLRSEGGFTTPEMSIGRGPTYTLLADGRLIYEGPVIMIFPGPLLPNYQIVQLTEEKVNGILDLVDEIGLPGMTSELDDSAASNVADATTEVVTYWDEDDRRLPRVGHRAARTAASRKGTATSGESQRANTSRTTKTRMRK